MTTSPLQLIEKDRRKRRWLIRLSLLLLLVLTVLGITAAIVFRSPPLSLDELRARLKDLPRDAGVAELKQLLGEPTEVNAGNLVWQVCYHTWNATDSVVVTANDVGDGIVGNRVAGDGVIRFKTMFEMHVEGKDAWLLRWNLLLHQFGWK